MEGYTSVQQHVQLIKLFCQNGCSIWVMFCALQPLYGRRKRPTEKTIRRVVGKFEPTSSVNKETTPLRRRKATYAENIIAVCESVHENPRQFRVAHKNLAFRKQ